MLAKPTEAIRPRWIGCGNGADRAGEAEPRCAAAPRGSRTPRRTAMLSRRFPVRNSASSEREQPEQQQHQVLEEAPVVGGVAHQHPAHQVAAEELDEVGADEDDAREAVHGHERDRYPDAAGEQQQVDRDDRSGAAADPAQPERDAGAEQHHPVESQVDRTDPKVPGTDRLIMKASISNEPPAAAAAGPASAAAGRAGGRWRRSGTRVPGLSRLSAVGRTILPCRDERTPAAGRATGPVVPSGALARRPGAEKGREKGALRPCPGPAGLNRPAPQKRRTGSGRPAQTGASPRMPT